MDAEDWRPVSVIYVAPIRALLNNLEERLARYSGLIGPRAFKWHGDVAAATKQRFIADPTDLLLTTPESLEVMLMSRKVPAERLFRGLRAVVIDEIHAFVADDRGGHLAAVLERLTRFCGHDVQRIGLSATVGNPADPRMAGRELAADRGSSSIPGAPARQPRSRSTGSRTWTTPRNDRQAAPGQEAPGLRRQPPAGRGARPGAARPGRRHLRHPLEPVARRAPGRRGGVPGRARTA
jgi:ATP-dependent helicase YprA (DUF1998 family)